MAVSAAVEHRHDSAFAPRVVASPFCLTEPHRGTKKSSRAGTLRVQLCQYANLKVLPHDAALSITIWASLLARLTGAPPPNGRRQWSFEEIMLAHYGGIA